VPTGTPSSASTQRAKGSAAALAAIGAAGACAALAAPAAFGQASSGGGAAYVAQPRIDSVRCVERCLAGGRVETGGKLKLRGSGLRGVTRVVYLGGSGSRDDVEVRTNPTGDRSLTVAVPFGARSGRLKAWAGTRRASRPTEPIGVVVPAPPEPSADLRPLPGAPHIETATNRSRFFLGANGGVSFAYRVNGERPTAVEVALIRLDDATAVQSWRPPAAAPGEVQGISWEGTEATGAPAPEGRYAFRIATAEADGTAVQSAEASPDRDSFDFRQHIFPVRGRHDFGGPGARFGTGRAGHVHQGHDVFASCGTRLVAARGGTIKAKQYHAAAGHYVVIDGEQTGVDYAYMHLEAPTPFARGDRVYTGQQIGTVGETGNAHGCHLHFEMWSEPGWYTGGRPFDPFPHLQAWDAVS
jgi:murein DD-endopeptidase MepM/ murein hydrolase activator NlpD